MRMAAISSQKFPGVLVLMSLMLTAMHTDGVSRTSQVDQMNVMNRSMTSVNESSQCLECIDLDKILNETYDEPYLMESNEWISPNESLYTTEPKVATTEPIKKCIPVQQCTEKCGGRTVKYFNQCQCDDVCWFYGDCCFDYYTECLNVSIFDSDDTILRALLVNVGSYSQLLRLHDAYKWRRLSSCVQLHGRTFQAVNACGDDPALQVRFEKLHEKINRRSADHVNIFEGISKSDIANRCQLLNSGLNQSVYILDSLPVSLNTSYVTVYFYNIFCAICNGVDPADVTLVEQIAKCSSDQWRNTSWPHVQGALDEECQTQPELPDDMRKCSDIHQSYKNSVFDLESQVHSFGPVFIPKLHSKHSKIATKIADHQAKKQNQGGDRARAKNANGTANGGAARRCNSLVPVNARLCHMYAYPQVITAIDLVFKNPHCQLCLANRAAQAAGGHLLDAYMCPDKTCLCQKSPNIKQNIQMGNLFYNKLEGEMSQDIPSFRILYDFKTRDTTITVNKQLLTINTKSCPANHVYVPYYQKCAEITCTRGTYLVGQKCVRVKGCSATDNCHKNYTASHVLFPNVANTVVVKLRLWYALDDVRATRENVTRTDRGKDENLPQTEMWYQPMNVSSYSTIGSNNTRFSDNSFNLPAVVFGEDVQKAVHNISRSTSKAQKKLRERSNAPRLTPYFEHEVILANILTVEKMRTKWLEHKLKTGEYNKTDQLIQLATHAKQAMAGQLERLLNHTVELSEDGVSLQVGASSKASDSCIYMTLNLNGDLPLDTLISLFTNGAAVSNLINVAHDANFILRDITLANALMDTERNVSQSLQSTNKQSDDVMRRYCKNGTVLHSELMPVSYNETGLSYYVEFTDIAYPLSSFLYTAAIDVDDTTRVPRMAQANVSWCREDMGIFDCNYTTVLFNKSHFIRYNTSIVITSHMKEIKEFLRQFSESRRNTVSVREFVRLFQELHRINDTTIYEMGEYRVDNDQVFVCSDFSLSYEVRNESIVSQLYSYMPQSSLERLTTLIALSVSITCLVVVLVVYSLVPELRNIPGRIVMSMSSALLLAQVLFLCCSYPQGLLCEVYASFHHGAWLASFAWLTAMSVHLTFILHSNSHGSLQSTAYTFPIISIICWGLPFLLAGSCFTLDKTGVISIDYGKNGVCWIGNVESMLFAFGVPLFLLLAVTSVCAVFVVRAIRNSSDFRTKNTATHKGVRTHLLLCVNLALLMGFNWIFYFVAVAVEASSTWAVFIFTNGSQGLYIFLCYVARKSVVAKLCRRLNLCQSSSENYGRTVGSQPATRVMTLTTTLSKDVALSVASSRQGTPSTSPLPSPLLNYRVFKI